MFRIGIWLDYGTAPMPDREPGLSARRFVAELLDLGEELEVVLLVRRGDLPDLRKWIAIPRPGLEVRVNDQGNVPVAFHQARACDVWLFPAPVLTDPLNVPSVVHVPEEFAARLQSQLRSEWIGREEATLPNFVASATLCVAGSDAVLQILRDSLALSPAQTRLAGQSGQAGELLAVCREAAAIARLPETERIGRCARPWSDKPIPMPEPVGPPEIFLFLPVVYPGGIWQASKDLLLDLIEVNRERGELVLTFGLPDDEGDPEVIAELRQRLTVDRFELSPITPAEAGRMLGKPLPADLPDGMLFFMKGCESHSLRADAWFALADRFRFPLLPARPYGVLIYDMIQRHAPETFPARFFDWVERGMKPTMERAELLFTASESTRQDVLASYDVDPDRVRMIPIATAPGRRFRGLEAEPVALPRTPFLLQVTNIAPHKGIKVMLRGYARLKERLGERTPLLVVCGYGTELVAPSSPKPTEDPNMRETRQLVRDLGLREKLDVVFLGFVGDAQLLDLYRRCAAVVNAARYDLGTLCAIEARYFGRPVVSSRYPAIEEMARRFELPIHFFPVEDDLALADQLEAALAETPLAGAELDRIREEFDHPRLTHRHYAEGLYQLLVALGTAGRNARQRGDVR